MSANRGSVIAVVVWFGLATAAFSHTLRFGVIGDSGTGDQHQKAVAARMSEYAKQWEFILMLGDNIYPDGNPADFEANFKSPYKNLRDAGLRFHATLGNHDRVHRDAELGCKQVRDAAFGFENQRDEYSFSAGGEADGKPLARFIALNADGWRKPGEPVPCGLPASERSKQLNQWLEDSSKFHWNIVLLHNPLYSYVYHWLIPPFFHGHGSDKRLRALLEPRLKDNVDVVFSGHDHFYQKIKPQNGIHYFVSGAAAKLRRGGNHGHKNLEKGARIRHFLDIELTASEFRYRAIDVKGNVFHSGTIVKRIR